MQLRREAAAARERVLRHTAAPAPVESLDAARRELAARRALFKADLDVLFHKAECPVCRQSASTSSAEICRKAA